MISDSITQLARTALLLLDYAERQGLDRKRLIRAAGLPADIDENPDSRIRTRSMVHLWRAVSDALDDPALGIRVGASIQARQIGLVGYAIYHSRDSRAALQRFARYVRILSEAIQFGVEDRAEGVIITWQLHPALATLRFPAEAGAALIVALGRDITGVHVKPLVVDLPGPRPGDSSVYKEFFGGPVRFDRPVASITLSREQASLPTQAPDDTLVGYLDDLAAINLNPLDDHEETMVDAVRRTLWTMLPGGRPDLWRTADELNVSVRTLQRRLGEEGTSFSKVLDELRRDLSRELLMDRNLSVSEVAFMLGYSEPSAFQRAYRRWWGVSARRSVA